MSHEDMQERREKKQRQMKVVEMLIECVEESSTDITINSPCGSYKWELNNIVRSDFLIKSLKARLEKE